MTKYDPDKINTELTAKEACVSSFSHTLEIARDFETQMWFGTGDVVGKLTVIIGGRYNSYQDIINHIFLNFKHTIQTISEFRYMDSRGVQSVLMFNKGKVVYHKSGFPETIIPVHPESVFTKIGKDIPISPTERGFFLI